MSDTIWVPAYIRRKPAKPEIYRQKHDELRAARTYDLIRQQQIFAEDFAAELDRELQELRT
jgi:hypothetical protein